MGLGTEGDHRTQVPSVVTSVGRTLSVFHCCSVGLCIGLLFGAGSVGFWSSWNLLAQLGGQNMVWWVVTQPEHCMIMEGGTMEAAVWG